MSEIHPWSVFSLSFMGYTYTGTGASGPWYQYRSAKVTRDSVQHEDEVFCLNEVNHCGSSSETVDLRQTRVKHTKMVYVLCILKWCIYRSYSIHGSLFNSKTFPAILSSNITSFWFLLFWNSYWNFLHYPFGEGNGTPLQYSCLENPMDGGAW